MRRIEVGRAAVERVTVRSALVWVGCLVSMIALPAVALASFGRTIATSGRGESAVMWPSMSYTGKLLGVSWAPNHLFFQRVGFRGPLGTPVMLPGRTSSAAVASAPLAGNRSAVIYQLQGRKVRIGVLSASGSLLRSRTFNGTPSSENQLHLAPELAGGALAVFFSPNQKRLLAVSISPSGMIASNVLTVADSGYLGGDFTTTSEPSRYPAILWDSDGPPDYRGVLLFRRLIGPNELSSEQPALPPGDLVVTALGTISAAADGSLAITWLNSTTNKVKSITSQPMVRLVAADGTLGPTVGFGPERRGSPGGYTDLADHALSGGGALAFYADGRSVVGATVSATGLVVRAETIIPHTSNGLLTIGGNGTSAVVAIQSISARVSSIYATRVGAGGASAVQLLARGSASVWPAAPYVAMNPHGTAAVTWGTSFGGRAAFEAP